MKDVTGELLPEYVVDMIKNNYDEAIQRIGNGIGFGDASPIQPLERLPKEFSGMPNGHNGTHHFLVDDFCRACTTGKLSPTNIWEVAKYNLPGLIAHKSALAGGVPMEVPYLGEAPEDWETLSYLK